MLIEHIYYCFECSHQFLAEEIEVHIGHEAIHKERYTEVEEAGPEPLAEFVARFNKAKAEGVALPYLKLTTKDRHALTDRLAEALPELLESLHNLVAEVAGMLGIAEAEVRQIVGNTNMAALKYRFEKARAAIAKAEQR